MDINQLINLVAMITLFEMMVTIGMGVTVPEVTRVAADWRLVLRAAIANYILAPAAAVSLLILFKADPYVAAGFLVISVCPGAPYGPPFTALARGDVPQSVGLMVILAGTSALLAPLLLGLLIPVVAGNAQLSVNSGKMVVTLALGQFLPLFIGVVLRMRRPGLADRLKIPAARLSTLLNLLLLALILTVQFRMLAAIQPRGYFGMICLLAAMIMTGLIMGGWTTAGRKCMVITTAVRNVGVGLVIATASFPGTPAVTAATAYGLIQTVGMALVAAAWGRSASPTVTSSAISNPE